jgi:outer membrane immunogenic protein
MARVISPILAAAFSVFCGAAVAADMPVKAPMAPVAVPSWTGFYIGAHIGAAWSDQDGTSIAGPSPGFGAPAIGGAGIPGVGILPTAHDLEATSLLFGAHIGYNWQFGQMVAGLEADVSALNRDSDNLQATITTFAAPASLGSSITLSASNSWLASARARLGFAWTPTMLAYATGGVAWTRTTYGAFWQSGTFVPGGVAATGFSQNETGWVAGAGLETMLAPNWLLRAEYLYYHFDGAAGAMVTTVPTCTPATCFFNLSWSDLDMHTVRAAISYKF